MNDMKKIMIFGMMIILIGASSSICATNMINESLIQEKNFFIDQTSMEFVNGEIIIKLKENIAISSSSILDLNEKHHVYDFEKVFPNADGTVLDNFYILYAPNESDIPSLVLEYMSCPDVEYAEPNQKVTLFGIPNDENFSKQWYLNNIGQVFLDWEGHNYSGIPDSDIDAPEAWEMETGSPDVVIAIIDTGVDYMHPDLEANIWNNDDEIPDNGIDDDNNGYIDDIRGWNFLADDNDPKDYYGHGTMCAGIAAAVTNNKIGVAGICHNCKIMPIIGGIFDLVNVVKSIRYAANNGADIISMSFGIKRWSFLVKNTIDYAFNKGVFLCAAAGNSNRNVKGFPAGFDNVVAVAATNQNDERCTSDDWRPGMGSNYGDWVDIAAPGSHIFTTFPTYHVFMNDFDMAPWPNIKQNYSYGGGTSSSSPVVAGVAALLLSKDPSLTPDELKALLCGNVDQYNSKEFIGTGRVNAQKALAALESDIKVKIEGGLRIKMIITNNKITDVTGIEWEINVQGGFFGLINKYVNGTVDIKAGESKTVSTGMLCGIGKILINAKADIVGRSVKGKQLLLLSIII
jgi:subtilisin family serine protease